MRRIQDASHDAFVGGQWRVSFGSRSAGCWRVVVPEGGVRGGGEVFPQLCGTHTWHIGRWASIRQA